MRKNLALLFLLLAALLGGGAALQAQTAEEFGAILNLSGRQRMLSQKMSKELLQVALNLNKASSLKALDATAQQFDQILNGLKVGNAELGLPASSDFVILFQINVVETTWGRYQTLIQRVQTTGKVTDADVTEISQTSLKLLKESNQLVTLFELASKRSGLKADPVLASIINVAGRQRMLSQKMSKELLLIHYGVDVEANKLNLLATGTQIDRPLKGLIEGDSLLGLPATREPVIRERLLAVQAIWERLFPVVDAASRQSTTTIPEENLQVLLQENLPLLKTMNEAVGLFAQLAASS